MIQGSEDGIDKDYLRRKKSEIKDALGEGLVPVFKSSTKVTSSRLQCTGSRTDHLG